MAGMSKDRNGNYIIQFVGADRRRRTVRIGVVPKRTAEAIRLRVELLNVAALTNTPIDPDTAAWAAGVGDDLCDKLARAGLIEARRAIEVAKLGAFLTAYIDSRTDVKPNTRRNLLQSRRYLVEFFGDARELRGINKADASRFGFHMKGEYAEATAARVIKHARQFFTAAAKDGLVPFDPFADVKAGSMENRDRMHFVTIADTEKMIAAAPDGQWRLLIALARYGGLRTPSEPLALTWADVDWDRGRVLIRSPKTGNRWIPLFPELRPHLEEAFEAVEEGAVYVITKARDAGTNFRTTFDKIVVRAGLSAWEKPFQNMRASRETELTQAYPLHVVTAWIGNSAAVACKHYLQVTDSDFEKGAALGAARALHFPVQSSSDADRQRPSIAPENAAPKEDAIVSSEKCSEIENRQVPLTGVEPVF